jgi:hypothetical protein
VGEAIVYAQVFKTGNDGLGEGQITNNQRNDKQDKFLQPIEKEYKAVFAGKPLILLLLIFQSRLFCVSVIPEISINSTGCFGGAV